MEKETPLQSLPLPELTLPIPPIELPSGQSELVESATRIALTPEQKAEQEKALAENRPFEATQEITTTYDRDRTQSLNNNTAMLHDDLPEHTLDGYQGLRNEVLKTKAIDDTKEFFSTHPLPSLTEMPSPEPVTSPLPHETTYPNTMVQTPLEKAIDHTGADSDISVVGTPEEIKRDTDALLPLVELKSPEQSVASGASAQSPRQNGEIPTPPPPPVTEKPSESMLKRIMGMFWVKKEETTIPEKQPAPALESDLQQQAKQSAQDIQEVLSNQLTNESATEKQPITVNL